VDNHAIRATRAQEAALARTSVAGLEILRLRPCHPLEWVLIDRDGRLVDRPPWT